MSSVERLHPTVQEAFEVERKRADDAEERLLRVFADDENRAKRLEQEQTRQIRFANERLLISMLDVFDNLERCLEGSAHGADALREGLRLTLEQFYEAMESAGAEPVAPDPGTPFDPTVHEAVMVDQRSDLPPRTIVEVIQKGFLFHQRLLRPARVVVSARRQA